MSRCYRAALGIAKLIDAKILPGNSNGRLAEESYAFSRNSGGINGKKLEKYGFIRLKSLYLERSKVSVSAYSKTITNENGIVTITVVFNDNSGFGSIDFYTL
jgi:hypothetical protein